jgi:hypothetical protein
VAAIVPNSHCQLPRWSGAHTKAMSPRASSANAAPNSPSHCQAASWSPSPRRQTLKCYLRSGGRRVGNATCVRPFRKTIEGFRLAWAWAPGTVQGGGASYTKSRRTFAREMRRPGSLNSWGSPGAAACVFDRYSIIGDGASQELRREDWGQAADKPEAPTPPAESLSSSAPTTPL